MILAFVAATGRSPEHIIRLLLENSSGFSSALVPLYEHAHFSRSVLQAASMKYGIHILPTLLVNEQSPLDCSRSDLFTLNLSEESIFKIWLCVEI